MPQAGAQHRLISKGARLNLPGQILSRFGQEELAEGLHLIDFEQLKIENQTYNEKIEERNEVSALSVSSAKSTRVRVHSNARRAPTLAGMRSLESRQRVPTGSRTLSFDAELLGQNGCVFQAGGCSTRVFHGSTM